ncbi:MAG: DUF2914 domain-containing protein [Candidatus Methylomirabilales bacterium]
MSPWWTRAAVMLVAVVLPSLALSEEQKPDLPRPQLRVIRDVVTTGVIHREPIDAATVFPPSVGTLYYFTEVVGATTPTRIIHIWSFKGQRVAEIFLLIEADHWRTWSRKQILQNWIGSWEVEAVDPDGHVLSSQTFDIH